MVALISNHQMKQVYTTRMGEQQMICQEDNLPLDERLEDEEKEKNTS